MPWKTIDTCLRYIRKKKPNYKETVKIAAFDLDGTLINRNRQTQIWTYLDSNIIKKLNEYLQEGYFLIIFTNQSGIGNNKNFKLDEWKLIIRNLFNDIIGYGQLESYYMAVYVATQFDFYRKPNIEMWKLMYYDIKKRSGFDKINISDTSFYCGDAAGRIVRSYYKKTGNGKDFSDVDIKFALNLNLKFFTPEELFLGFKREKYIVKKIKYNEVLNRECPKLDNKYKKNEMIIMVGLPGSGKSIYVRNNFDKHYGIVNQDECGTRKKCDKALQILLDNGMSVVIDATNYTSEMRAHYIEIARQHNYKVRCIIMNTDTLLSKHLNAVRHVYSNGKIPLIGGVVYNKYNKNYEKPKKSEGFYSIEYANVCFSKKYKSDKKWMRIFHMYFEY